jgi:toxin ParE1/3/4
MSQTQTVTIELPDVIFQQLTQIAADNQQSIEQLIAGNLITYSPPSAIANDLVLQQALAELQAISLDALQPLIQLKLLDILARIILVLDPDDRQFLDQKVSQGLADNINLSNEELRQAVLVGMADVEAGRYTTYDEAGLQTFFDDIQRKAQNKITPWLVLQELGDYWIVYGDALVKQRLGEIKRKILQLGEFPGLGRSREDLSPGLRSIAVRDILILYRSLEGLVLIVRVTQGSRNLKQIFEDPDEES